MTVSDALKLTGVVVLAAAFVVSGMNKIVWSHAFERTVHRSPVALSRVQTKAVLVCVPFVECVLGIAVLFTRLRRAVLYAMVSMLVVRMVLHIEMVLMGLNVVRGCCGSVKHPLGAGVLAMNSVLLIIAVWLLQAALAQVRETT